MRANSFVFAKGQVWKTERGFVAIDRVGKRLMDYRLLKKLGQKAVRSQMSTHAGLADFLQANAGHLIKGG